MPKENTPRRKPSQGPPVRKVSGTSEVADRLCNVDWMLSDLGISEENRKLLKEAGLPILRTIGRVDIGIERLVVEFFKFMPELGERPSVARKKRHIARKAKEK